MKKGHIISAVIGGFCFAIPYTAFNFTIPVALVLGIMGYGAGNLVFVDGKKTDLEITKDNIDDIIALAKKKNTAILNMINKVEDEELQKNIREIFNTANQIIKTVEKDNKKIKNVENFFTYYLPETFNLLQKYDEIENQNLGKSSEEFMKKTRDMISKIKDVFKQQLAHLYQNDIIDTNAEMKVFDTMIKSDGYGDSDFKL